MRRRWREAATRVPRSPLAWIVTWLLLPPAALAAVPVGPEFQVNTSTTFFQWRPSVAVDGDGDVAVVWQSYVSSGTDGSPDSIQGQRYASDGTALGSEFQVNTYTTYGQSVASVAVEGDGDFVVVWYSYGSSGTDPAHSIQGQRYASDGTALGSEFQVNTYTASYQWSPSVAVEGDGDFVVVWPSAGSSGTDDSAFSIQGQRYASDGTALGSEFQVNTYTTSDQANPSVAVEGDGDFVVVWQSLSSSGTDDSVDSIQGQRYASDGTALGSEFQVNTYTTYAQSVASVAVEGDGDFVVVWQSYGSSGTDTAHSIQGQRYASDGTALGSEFQVNTYTTSDQENPSVAMEGDGDFAVVWESRGSSGTDTSFRSVQGQRYGSDGTALGSEFQVNTYTTSDQILSSVAVEADGDFVVAWTSIGSSGTDNLQFSVQAQRFGADETDADGDGIANGVDDCIDVANPAQLDADGDGCGNACDADFDQNSVVGGADFNVLRLCFGQSVPGLGPPDDPTCAESDLDGDGVVGAADFNGFRLEFGTAPGRGSPSCL